MHAIRMDGKATAEAIYEECRRDVSALSERGVTPGLTVILAGDDPASQVYVRNKARACERVGIRSEVVRLPENVSQVELFAQIDRVNADPTMHGLLIQLPLPAHLDEAQALARVNADKDVDGFHLRNAGKLFTGTAGVVPCTPAGIMELLRRYDVGVSGARAVVIGRSNIVGKPVAMLLMNANATVTVCHSRTRDLASITREADILVAAVGRPNFVRGDMIKPGAAVVDVGINRLPDGKLVGDVCFAEAETVASAITPVPGGVGPMTIAMLMRNTIQAAQAHA